MISIGNSYESYQSLETCWVMRHHFLEIQQKPHYILLYEKI